ncbi:hypothetical protein DPMN_120954 [Dreissena polymorpha]|uniref:Uncharacterized protein n=1 Tax=Dreissena polymorpha TaxID=45954 RepID=A0A9D4GLJ3_DREPO|nr:hypothetical protein DPMN_120954 [Dreissena polymorpha]
MVPVPYMNCHDDCRDGQTEHVDKHLHQLFPTKCRIFKSLVFYIQLNGCKTSTPHEHTERISHMENNTKEYVRNMTAILVGLQKAHIYDRQLISTAHIRRNWRRISFSSTLIPHTVRPEIMLMNCMHIKCTSNE